MKVFVDTNVWIASLVARGTCAELVEHLVAQHDLLASDGGLTELERVLGNKFDYPETRVREVLEWVGEVGEIVDTPSQPPAITDDRDDDFVLQAAIEGGADVLVSGDTDLLEVNAEVSVHVLEPAEFWRIG